MKQVSADRAFRVGLLVSALCCSIVLIGRHASALEQVIHASVCHADSAVVADSGSNGGQGMDVGTHAVLICPLVEDSDNFPKEWITTLGVHGYKSGSGDLSPAYVKTCRANSTTNGGTCSTATTITGSGAFTVNPSVSAWNTSGGLGFFVVDSGSYGISLRGFSVNDD